MTNDYELKYIGHQFHLYLEEQFENTLDGHDLFKRTLPLIQR